MRLTTPTHARAAFAPRRGFTLIEILVVLAIILVLIGLTGAALQRAGESQRNRSSEDQLNKLQPALQREYQDVVAQCAKDARDGQIPASLVAYCGEDERARSVWTAFKLRLHFPQTFGEANSTVLIQQLNPPNPPVTIYSLPPLVTFNQTNGLTSGTPEQQSTALLYIILANKSAGSSGGFAADDVTQGMQRDVEFTGPNNRRVTLKTFGDAWGNSIGFRRWERNAETDSDDYRDLRAPFPDPLDPQGKVSQWTTTAKRDFLVANFGFSVPNRNRVMTVYSLGKNKIFDNFATNSDDLVGYRIQRLGNRGK